MADKKHIVKEGECISSIAFKYGFLPDTVWKDSQNSKLREQRGNPNMLVEGDVVAIPEKRLREESAATEKRHRFRRKGVPETFRLQLLDSGMPRKTVNYQIDIEGVLIKGTTDDEGWLEHPIPPNARKGKILVEGDQDWGTLLLGTLPPIEVDEGVVMRLINLGYLDEEEKGDEEALADAIADFQEYCNLPVTGKINEETRKKLVEIHQC